MATYASVANFKSYVPQWTDGGYWTDPLLEKALLEAEKHIDNAVGLWAVDEATGRKFVPGDMETWRSEALRDATCAQVEYIVSKGWEFFSEFIPQAASGPDRSITWKESYIGPKTRRELVRGQLYRITAGGGKPAPWLPTP